MNTNDKLLKATEQAETVLDQQISYCTDDDDKLAYLFVWKAPGLKMYPGSFGKPISRMSVDAIAAEIVEHFRPMLRPGPGRPALDVKRHNITITDALWTKAESIGGGNASDGIRKALDAWL